jgi:pyruvate dehydrogenase E2 component (dihydrolipoamide acetyltransferase)
MAEFKLPTLGETASSGVIAKVLVNVGDKVEKDQPVLELETDKAVLEVPSTVAGVVKELLVKQGENVAVDQPVFSYDDGGAAAPAPVAAAPAKAPETTPVKGDGVADSTAPVGTQAPPVVQSPDVVRDPAPAAPSTRRIARELGVDIYAVKGSGLGGRISEDDVKAVAEGRSKTSAPAAAPVSGGITLPPLPDFSKLGETVRIPMSGIAKATSNQMDRAWTIPHVTQFDKCDSTAFDAFRKKYGPLAEKKGTKLTPTAILLKITVAALKKFPNFNASIDFATNEVVQKKFYNIGVAVDTPRGLVVPVIKNADSKGIIELAVELNEIAATAREGKLKPEQMTGATFTLTNLGGIGGTGFTPIVNTPEVAILGIARGAIEPVWNKESNSFEPKMMMPLCLSYDHRVINGADGARFTRFIASLIEDPSLIALEG